MLTHLESHFHVTDAEPYALYQADFAAEENPVVLLHWHPEAEFFLVQEGALIFTIEQTEHLLSAGDAIFVPPHTLHTARAVEKNGQLRAIVFSTDLIALPADARRHSQYVQPILHGNSQCSFVLRHQEAAHAPLLASLHRLFADCDLLSNSDLLAEGYIRVLWQYLHAIHPMMQASAMPSASAQLVQQAQALIHSRFAEDISLADLASALHVSPSHLSRIFHGVTGIPPFTYLNKYRIMKSCELLRSTDKKISDIAFLCGFNNISYFNREFLHVTKSTPSAFRKMQRLRPGHSADESLQENAAE